MSIEQLCVLRQHRDFGFERGVTDRHFLKPSPPPHQRRIAALIFNWREDAGADTRLMDYPTTQDGDGRGEREREKERKRRRERESERE